MHLALATALSCPDLQADDQSLGEALRSAGAQVVVTPWNDGAIPWKSFDAVVLRSTWDYYREIDAFRRWLDALDAMGVRLLNPTAMVRWNLNKGYLLELAAAGIPILESSIFAAADLPDALEARGHGRVVVKPTEGATAWLTLAGEPGDSSFLNRIRTLPRDRDFLVQPFHPEICEEGEWSLVFFHGCYSHAVLKRPAHGDFRVQPEYGGTEEPVVATAALRTAASAILKALETRGLGCPAYARVDGLRRQDRFLLMELELIEPKLFLAGREGAGAALSRPVLAELQTPA